MAAKALSTYFLEVVWCMYGPTQVKWQLLLFSSIFDALNFHHFLEVLEIIFYSISEKCWKLKVEIWAEEGLNWRGVILRKTLVLHEVNDISITVCYPSK